VYRFIAIAIVVAACSGGTTPTTTVSPSPATVAAAEPVLIPPATASTARNQLGFAFPGAPPTPSGPADTELTDAIGRLFDSFDTAIDLRAIDDIANAGDARAAWLLADLLRFLGPSNARSASLDAFERLTSAVLANDPVADRSPWQSVTDHLIAWDLPPLPDYREWKGELFTLVDERWQPFFDDADADIDWRVLSWGGVLMDARPLGDSDPCPQGCIPALDDPAVTDAAGGDWYPDDRVVFGVTVGSESRAYPRNLMEVHEMVNDTIGGRRVGIPYCTLCGSAQAYFTDSVPANVEVPVLRTSGLLTRSNKVMFDLNTFSVFDTFTGVAVSGPLHGLALEQTPVIVSTWGEWKSAHPDTTIVAEDGGIGRSYALDPLQGRDDDGPIFPVGDVDERLPVQEKVLGVIAADGTPVAFPVAAAGDYLRGGSAIEVMGIEVVADGSGLRARGANGSDVIGHEAFWFAWSQFHPATLVWSPPAG
jgi:hypothetical protein